MVEPAGHGAPNGSQKLQQSSDEQYTHGGVKKTKFEPKVPTRRAKKLPSSKSEPQPQAPTADSNNNLPKELHRLLQQQTSSNDHGRGRERTSRVAFGFGNSSSSTQSETKPTPRVASAVISRPSSSTVTSAVSRPSPRGVPEKQEFLHAPEPKPERNVEVFDHDKYYPVTLPLRKPIAGVDTRSLDDDEFEVDQDAQVEEEEDEDGAEAAEELGLRAQKDEDSLFFFQFPKGLPLSLNATGKELKKPLRAARLEDLGKGGAMGKLLVYESGAVKLQVGDVVFDALPGTACTFAEEVAAVNTTAKQCSFVGEVHQRVVLTPDIIDVLPDLTDLRTKR